MITKLKLPSNTDRAGGGWAVRKADSSLVCSMIKTSEDLHENHNAATCPAITICTSFLAAPKFAAFSFLLFLAKKHGNETIRGSRSSDFGFRSSEFGGFHVEGTSSPRRRVASDASSLASTVCPNTTSILQAKRLQASGSCDTGMKKSFNNDRDICINSSSCDAGLGPASDPCVCTSAILSTFLWWQS